jgi:hypothetical protein
MTYVAYGIFGLVGLMIVLRLSVEYIPPIKRWWKARGKK